MSVECGISVIGRRGKMLKRLLALIRKFFASKLCLYINSNNVLPAPLDEATEMELLLKARDGDMEARNTLIVHNLRLVVYIAKKFESTKINIEDLISIGSMGLIKGVQTFKIEKNIKLATYASRCIENEILMYLRKTHKMRQEVSLDEILNVDSEGNEMVLADILAAVDEEALETMTKDEDRKEIYQALDNLPKREQDIIIMRFGLFGHKPLTQKEVADILGISQSYISRLEKRIIDKMRHEIENRAIV
jgi:RNA polymerase sporulation-specific sigma factor